MLCFLFSYFCCPGIAGNYWFQLSMGERVSNNIHIHASANNVKEQLQNMTRWYCSFDVDPERAYYYNGFETRAWGPEWGYRVFTPQPNCGRYSLKNPDRLFKGGETKDLNGRTLTGYDVARYSQVIICGYNKVIKSIRKAFLYLQIERSTGMSHAPSITHAH